MSNLFKSILCKIKNYLYRSKYQKNAEYSECYRWQQQLLQKPTNDLTEEEKRLVSAVRSSERHTRFLFFGLPTTLDDNHHF